MSKKKGRPSNYSEELGDKICEEIRNGSSLNAVCQGKDIPSQGTVYAWAIDPEHPFSAKYVRAREICFLREADKLFAIADDGEREDVQRDRLRVDTRKWVLSKMLPKVFGERIVQEHAGEITTKSEPADPRDLARAVLAIFNAAKLESS